MTADPSIGTTVYYTLLTDSIKDLPDHREGISLETELTFGAEEANIPAIFNRANFAPIRQEVPQLSSLEQMQAFVMDSYIEVLAFWNNSMRHRTL